MYYINKIAWFILNPMMLFLWLALAGYLLRHRYPRVGRGLVLLVFAALYFSSTFVCAFLLGYPLEKSYVDSQDVTKSPSASAIVLLGGGMRYVEALKYPEMEAGADRVWQASRLYKAGKAPFIIVSGRHDLDTTVPLLVDLGVPREAIKVDNESRNTYENSRFTASLAGKGSKILLVTSAWHMSRAKRNFIAAGLQVEPSACDFRIIGATDQFYLWDYIAPSSDNLVHAQVFFKEWLGRLARK